MLHTELSDKHEPLCYYAFAFTGLHFDNVREDNCIFDVSDRPEFKIGFRNMFQRLNPLTPFSEDYVYNTFQNLIIQLIELTNSSFNPQVELAPSNELEEVKKHIDLNYYQSINLDEMAEIAFVSKSQLIRLFKKIYHTTPINYIIMKRISIAKFLLEHTDNSVTAVSNIVGFNSVSNFIKRFRETTGLTPTEYRDSLHKEV